MTKRPRLIWFAAAVLSSWLVLLPGLIDRSWRPPEPERVILEEPVGEQKIEPLLASRNFGLSFTAPADGLAGLDWRVVTYQRLNPIRLVLLLYELGPGEPVGQDPAARVPVRRAIIDGETVEDWGLAEFRFRPIDHSGGRRYYAAVFSPKAEARRCLGLILTQPAGPDERQGFQNGQPSQLVPSVRLLAAGGAVIFTADGWWLLAAVPAAVGGLAVLRTRGGREAFDPGKG